MPTICQWFDPCSTEFQASEHFKALSAGHRIVCVVLTCLAALCLCAVPVFRLLVERFKKLEESGINPNITNVAKEKLKRTSTGSSSEDFSISGSASGLNEIKQTAASVKKIDVGAFAAKFPKGSGVSTRTKKCLEKIKEMLAAQDKQLCDTEDSGDCFYMAFAIGLMLIKKENATPENVLKKVRELRLQVSKYVNTLKSNSSNNWVKTAVEDQYDGIDTYEQFIQNVHLTSSECKSPEVPIWGRENVEGWILCKIHRVNLRVFEQGVLYLSEDIAPEDFYGNPESFWCGTKEYPQKEADQTVEIVLYSGHFLGVVPLNSLS